MRSDLGHSLTKIRLWIVVLSAVGLFLGQFCAPASAQLAGNFSNVTGIKVTRLGNAVLVRIQTDGTVKFGGDYSDWIETENGAWDLKPTTSVRIRVVRTRAKLPAYVPIDAYPVDGAAISLGQSTFNNPYFSSDSGPNDSPKVDIDLRFATPVRIRKFSVEPGNAISFGDFLGPKEASIELANDRRSILLTVIPDRSDLNGAAKLDRLPPNLRTKKLSITQKAGDILNVESLHVPLREFLGELSVISGQKFAAREEEVQNLGVTLVMNANLQEIISTLITTFNLGIRLEGDTLILGKGDELFETRSFILNSIAPDKARLMFPDFLLPFLRTDASQSALIAYQTPKILDKIERDLKFIDTARPQFEIKAQVWEIVYTKETELSIKLLRSIGGDRQILDGEAGIVSLRIEKNQTDQLLGQLQALQSRSGARLLGTPRVSALSGATGSLFLGQTRYVKVLRQSGSSQIAQALPLKIGTELRVTPRGSAAENASVTVDIAPRVATVDSIENETGLPTLGIREFSSTVRVQSGDAVLLAGIDSDLNFEIDQKTIRVFPTKRDSREKRELIALVWVNRSHDVTSHDVTSVDNKSVLTESSSPVELGYIPFKP